MLRSRRRKRLRAAAPTKDRTLRFDLAPVKIEAAADEAGQPKKGPRKFDVTAYTGAPMNLAGYDHPVVVDLQGAKNGNSLVANLDHDRKQRVGNVTGVNNDGATLTMSGVANARTGARDEVIGSADDGFSWQASIEGDPGKEEFLKSGKTATVNGRTVSGPMTIVRACTLKGFAFVSHGADDNTSARFAASRRDPSTSDKLMEPELKAWIEKMGFVAEDLSEAQVAGLKANFEGKNVAKPERKKLTDVVERQKAEREREDKITAMAEEAIGKSPRQLEAISDLAGHAIEAKWEPEKFELELLRSTRPAIRANFSRAADSKVSAKMIEAAICRNGQLANLEKHYDAATLEASEDHYRHGLSLQEVLGISARSNGWSGLSVRGDLRGVLEAAFAPRGPGIWAEGLSSAVGLAGILSNIANKFLIEGWMAIDQTWKKISAMRAVNDFKTATSYSLTGGFEYDQLGPSGEIKHGTTGSVTYTNKADTYARMFGVSRADIINDDLGALTSVPRRLGRGAALKLNDIFWTAFLNNSSFFTSGNSNVSTGAGSALAIAGLQTAEATFIKQTDPDGKPLGIEPKILLVPPELKATAIALMTSELAITGATTLQPNANPFRARFRPESAPYMSNSTFTGYSSAAWYLLADPADLPVIEVAFLNGREAPIVETAQADFNILGIQMRGYHDFGVATQEYRGGVRSAGS